MTQPTNLPTYKKVYETPQAIVGGDGEPQFRLHRGTAFKHANTGDVYVILSLVYLTPTGIRPQVHSVILERKKDGKRFERTAEVIKEQIDAKKLLYDALNNDTRTKISLDQDDTRLIMTTVD